MKKIGNINIGSEKLINNEELINIRGGDSIYYCMWDMGCPVYGGPFYGQGYANSLQEAVNRVREQQYQAYNIGCTSGGGDFYMDYYC